MSVLSFMKRKFADMLFGNTKKYITASISYLAPNERLKGKKIIITGGGRGLGYSMAEKFSKEGALVLIAGRDEKMLKSKAEHIGCLYLKLDVQNVSELDEFMKNANEMLGGANCLVNNAGVSLHEGSIENVTPQQFDTQFNTNLRGSYFLSQKFIEFFEKSGMNNGNILFISSERGVFVDNLPYGLTKAALNSLTQGLAKLLVRRSIRVNAVAPGVTTSDMTGFKAEGNLYAHYNMNDRVYLPEEVAEIACFLLSDASGCLSGQILVCNEGKTINGC